MQNTMVKKKKKTRLSFFEKVGLNNRYLNVRQDLSKPRFRRRAFELDFLRGLAVIFMVFDHIMYDFIGVFPRLINDFPLKIYDLAVDYWVWDVRLIVRYGIIFIFMVVTGICCTFSKSNLRRGLKLGLISVFLTVGTYLLGILMNSPNMMITFGIIHCISLTLIVVGLLEKLANFKWLYLLLGVPMTIFGFVLQSNLDPMIYGDLPLFVTILKQIFALGRAGSDNASFVLFGGQILIGVFIGKALYQDRRTLIKVPSYKKHLVYDDVVNPPSKTKYLPYIDNPVNFCGRYSLFVYVGQQILVPVIGCLIMLMMGYTLNF